MSLEVCRCQIPAVRSKRKIKKFRKDKTEWLWTSPYRQNRTKTWQIKHKGDKNYEKVDLYVDGSGDRTELGCLRH